MARCARSAFASPAWAAIRMMVAQALGVRFVSDRRLLDDSRRAGVWPDSVQVIGGRLSMRLPTGSSGVAHYRSAARRSP